MYYSGLSADSGAGVQAFRGIGLAVSSDLLHWERLQAEPVLLGDGFPEFPGNKGIAGGGPIIEIPQANGRVRYRMHYTLATGTPSKDLLVEQAKYSVTAASDDGLQWTDRRIVMRPRLDAPSMKWGVVHLSQQNGEVAQGDSQVM